MNKFEKTCWLFLLITVLISVTHAFSVLLKDKTPVERKITHDSY